MRQLKKMRGSSRRVAGPKNATLSWDENESSQRLGFRLACDDSMRIYRGGPWHYPDDYARAENRVKGSPGARGGFLGFRLVREDT